MHNKYILQNYIVGICVQLIRYKVKKEFKLPLHTNPVPLNPSLQIQVKLPILFSHTALVEHGFDRHSFVSKQDFIDLRFCIKTSRFLSIFKAPIYHE